MLSVVSAIFRPSPSLPMQVLLGDEDVLEQRHRVLDAAQAHERVAVLDGHALGVVGQDERADAAACRLALGDLGHDDDDVGDRAVGRPQLAAVEQVAARRSASAVAPRRAGSEPTSGSVSRKAEMCVLRHLRQPLLLLLLGAEQHQRLGDADRLVRATAAWRATSARSPRARARGCSRPATGRGRRTRSGTFMPSAPSSLRPSSTVVGDLRVALDLRAGRRLARGTRAARRGSARPSRPRPGRAWAAGGSGRAGGCRGTAPCRSSAASTRPRGRPRRPARASRSETSVAMRGEYPSGTRPQPRQAGAGAPSVTTAPGATTRARTPSGLGGGRNAPAGSAVCDVDGRVVDRVVVDRDRLAGLQHVRRGGRLGRRHHRGARGRGLAVGEVDERAVDRQERVVDGRRGASAPATTSRGRACRRRGGSACPRPRRPRTPAGRRSRRRRGSRSRGTGRPRRSPTAPTTRCGRRARRALLGGAVGGGLQELALVGRRPQQRRRRGPAPRDRGGVGVVLVQVGDEREHRGAGP